MCFLLLSSCLYNAVSLTHVTESIALYKNDLIIIIIGGGGDSSVVRAPDS